MVYGACCENSSLCVVKKQLRDDLNKNHPLLVAERGLEPLTFGL